MIHFLPYIILYCQENSYENKTNNNEKEHYI